MSTNNHYLSDYRLENGILQPNLQSTSMEDADMAGKIVQLLQRSLNMNSVYYPEENLVWKNTKGEVSKFIHTSMKRVNFIIEYGEPLVIESYWKTRNFRDCIFDFLKVG